MLRELWATKDLSQLSAADLRRILNVYPPYVGAGIRVMEGTADFRRWVVEMRLYPFNRNYFGTHFGGSLYSMCDPWFVLILAKNLGPEFMVWDETATIHFRKPGKGKVRAVFELSPEEIERLRAATLAERRTHPVYKAEVRDEAGELIAEVEKTIYVRKRRPE